MNADDNDKLWELLGKTRRPEVSPFFARNVLRAVRLEEDAQAQRSMAARFSEFTRSFTLFLSRWTWRAALAGTCALAAIAAVTTLTPGFSPAFVRHRHAAVVQAGVARQIAGNPDYEVIKHLDELVADEESSLWLDDSVH